jgi:hypothetical protein
MTSDKEREFYGIVEGLDEPEISAASYIPKQCYGCPRAAELRHKIAMTAWTYSDLWRNCFDIADGDPELGKAIVRAMDRLKQQNLQTRYELSRLIAHCEGLASMCETIERNGKVTEVKITACMSPSLLRCDLDGQGAEG